MTDLHEMKLALEVFVKTKKVEKRENFYVFLKVSLLLVTLAWMVKGDPLSTLSPGVSSSFRGDFLLFMLVYNYE